MQADDEVRHRPEVQLRAVRIAGHGAGDRLPVADPGGLQRPLVADVGRRQFQERVQFGDLHTRLREHDGPLVRDRVAVGEVALADVVTAIEELRVDESTVGDVDLRQRPSGPDRKHPLLGVPRLADDLVEALPGLAEHVEPGQQRPVRAHVVDVDEFGDGRLMRDVGAVPLLRTRIVAVDHRLSPTCPTARSADSSAS